MLQHKSVPKSVFEVEVPVDSKQPSDRSGEDEDLPRIALLRVSGLAPWNGYDANSRTSVLQQDEVRPVHGVDGSDAQRAVVMGQKWGKPYAKPCHSMPNMRLCMDW